MARTLVIEVGLPARPLCGNGKAHGFARSKLVKEQRGQAELAAYGALAEVRGSLRGPWFPWRAGSRVRVDVLVRRDPLWSARRLDDDNLIRGLKGAIDGLTDAGVWHDDRQVRWGRIDWETATPYTGCVVLALTEEES